MAEQSAGNRHAHRRRDRPGSRNHPRFRSRVRANARVRTNQHIEKLRKAHRIEEAAAIQAHFMADFMADFMKESMEHAVQHKKIHEMLATFPHEPVKPVNAAVETVEAARRPTAAKGGRHSKGAHKA